MTPSVRLPALIIWLTLVWALLWGDLGLASLLIVLERFAGSVQLAIEDFGDPAGQLPGMRFFAEDRQGYLISLDQLFPFIDFTGQLLGLKR